MLIRFGIFLIIANNDSNLFDSKNYSESISYRNSGDRKVSVILNAWNDEDVYEAYKTFVDRKDHPSISIVVDRYAGSLLMPKYLVDDYRQKNDLTDWPNLYNMADSFQVTISALCVRLKQLGLIYIKDRKVYRNKEAALGQTELSF